VFQWVELKKESFELGIYWGKIDIKNEDEQNYKGQYLKKLF